ncbi:MAG TPA: rhomboid family intramembrane serine protease [Candidatus Polarisedimenticolaceae bacterium]|nr:rhomboid family intramembrane serine protease [Candidatus Polarisedimenticolaceae bacterium]
MSYYRSAPPRGGWGGGETLGLPGVTPVNRGLMIACGVVWAIQLLVGPLLGWIDLSRVLGLVPVDVTHGKIWQLVTYMFLHSPVMYSHILFNVLTMWMIGGDLERHWGGRKYLTYWFVCGIGAGVAVTMAGAFRGVTTPTIGASGAIYGLILAYGTIFAERRLLFMFLFPIKAKTLAWILFGVAFLSNLTPQTDGVSHLAHLGGMVVGWLYLRRAWRIGEFWRELVWRVRRRRFKVMPPDDPDRWVH